MGETKKKPQCTSKEVLVKKIELAILQNREEAKKLAWLSICEDDDGAHAQADDTRRRAIEHRRRAGRLQTIIDLELKQITHDEDVTSYTEFFRSLDDGRNTVVRAQMERYSLSRAEYELAEMLTCIYSNKEGMEVTPGHVAKFKALHCDVRERLVQLIHPEEKDIKWGDPCSCNAPVFMAYSRRMGMDFRCTSCLTTWDERTERCSIRHRDAWPSKASTGNVLDELMTIFDCCQVGCPHSGKNPHVHRTGCAAAT